MIRDPQKFMEGIWNWGILDGCFGKTKIKPTDLDGMVERNGRFLVIETKRPRVQVPDGQMRTFRELVATGVFTIIILWGHQDDPSEMMVMTPWGDKPKKATDLKGFRQQVAAWYAWADSQGANRAN